MRYFLKEIVERKLFLPNGAPVQFEVVDGTYGVLATDNPGLIAELDKAIANHVGGVVSISADQHAEAKKKLSLNPSLLNLPRERESLGPIPQSELSKLRSQGLAAVVGGVDAAGNVQPSLNPMIASPGRAQQQATSQKVDPIEVPKQFSIPRVGKPSAAKKAAASPQSPKSP